MNLNNMTKAQLKEEIKILIDMNGKQRKTMHDLEDQLAEVGKYCQELLLKYSNMVIKHEGNVISKKILNEFKITDITINNLDAKEMNDAAEYENFRRILKEGGVDGTN